MNDLGTCLALYASGCLFNSVKYSSLYKDKHRQLLLNFEKKRITSKWTLALPQNTYTS